MITEFIYPAVSFIAGLLTTMVCMPWLLKFCAKRGLYDLPNERKVHKNNIPRLGGAVFFPAALVGMGASLGCMSLLETEPPTFTVSTFVIVAGIFLIYLIGLLDDLLGLKATFKFGVQLIASLFMPLCGLYINNLYGFCGVYEIPLLVSYPLTVFVSLLIVNSINLIDGIDGLAAGLSLIALVAFTCLFGSLHVVAYTIFSAGLIGTLLVFLHYNMRGRVEHHTKTFMGDTGSLILGYALAYLALKYAMDKPELLPSRPNPLLTSFTLLAVPALDLTRVAFSRIRRGVSIFHADKTHIHHKLMAAGCSMRQALFCILGLQLLLIVVLAFGWFIDCNATLIVLAEVAVFTIAQCCLTERIKKVQHRS